MDLNEAADALLRLEQPKEQQNGNIQNENEESGETNQEANQEEELLDETQESEVKKIKIEFEGKELEVDESELLKGYKEFLKGSNRQEHLTKSFQEAAEKRKQAEALLQEFEQTLPVVNEYKARLDILDRVLETPPISLETLNQLLEDGDTEGYLRKKAELEQWQSKKLAVRSQQEELNKFMSEAQLKKTAALQQQERELLYKNFPDLAKEENAAKLAQYLTSYGYTPQELAQVVDHKNFIIAEKARRWDEFQAKAKDAKPVSNVPKVIKKGAATVSSDYGSEKYNKVSNQFRKTGSIHDAVELLLTKQKFKG